MVDIIARGDILTMNDRKEIITDGAVVVDDGKIVAVGKSEEIGKDYTADISLGGKKSIIMPGLINSHTHLSMSLLRGIFEGLTESNWLNRAWSIESNLTEEDVYAGAMLGIVQMIKTGTTCFADHYYHMDKVAMAVEKAGLRGALAEAILDFGDEQRGLELADKGKRFVERWNGKGDGRITGMMGPHSTYTCSPSTLKTIKEFAEDLKVPIHIHLQERRDEMLKVKEKWGERPIALLQKLGVLNNNLLTAHVVFLQDDELGLLAKGRVNVSNCVYGKMKGAQGIARAREMLDSGINVSLGTDGPATHNNLDMFEEMKFSIAAQSLKYRIPNAITPEEALMMATINGVRSIHIERTTGSIEKDKDADFIVIDGNAAKAVPYHNLPSIVAQTVCGDDVVDSVVQGRVIMKNRKILTLNESDVIDLAERHFYDIMERNGIEPSMKGYTNRSR